MDANARQVSHRPFSLACNSASLFRFMSLTKFSILTGPHMVRQGLAIFTQNSSESILVRLVIVLVFSIIFRSLPSNSPMPVSCLPEEISRVCEGILCVGWKGIFRRTKRYSLMHCLMKSPAKWIMICGLIPDPARPEPQRILCEIERRVEKTRGIQGHESRNRWKLHRRGLGEARRKIN